MGFHRFVQLLERALEANRPCLAGHLEDLLGRDLKADLTKDSLGQDLPLKEAELRGSWDSLDSLEMMGLRHLMGSLDSLGLKGWMRLECLLKRLDLELLEARADFHLLELLVIYSSYPSSN
jgi:hypothetical protein